MPLFNVLTSKGLSANSVKSGDRRAAERQTEAEHNNLLDISALPEFNTVMSMSPGPQREMAIKVLNAQAQLAEKEYPKYWNDDYPRRPITQSSSFVGDVDYDPYSQIMTVNLGNKSYSYSGQRPEDVASFINANSMGQYYNNNLKR